MIRLQTVDDLRSAFPERLPTRVRMIAHTHTMAKAQEAHELIRRLGGTIISSRFDVAPFAMTFAIDPAEVPILLLRHRFDLEVDELATAI